MKAKIKELKKTLSEWQKILEEQGEEWDNYERQAGEIDGLQYAIDFLEGVYEV